MVMRANVQDSKVHKAVFNSNSNTTIIVEKRQKCEPQSEKVAQVTEVETLSHIGAPFLNTVC